MRENFVLRQKHQEKKEEIQKSLGNFLPEIKISNFESVNDIMCLLRVISTKKPMSLAQRDKRPFVLAESVNLVQDEEVISRNIYKSLDYDIRN